MDRPHERVSLHLHAEIDQLRAILRGLASDDETEQQAAAGQATDVARVAAVLIRAVETQQSLERGNETETESALTAMLRRSLDAMTREEAAERATAEQQE
ncbi:MAG TPA: hypothetical protein VIC60_08895 [Thermomicrobiales bacterium]